MPWGTFVHNIDVPFLPDNSEELQCQWWSQDILDNSDWFWRLDDPDSSKTFDNDKFLTPEREGKSTTNHDQGSPTLGCTEFIMTSPTATNATLELTDGSDSEQGLGSATIGTYHFLLCSKNPGSGPGSGLTLEHSVNFVGATSQDTAGASLFINVGASLLSVGVQNHGSPKVSFDSGGDSKVSGSPSGIDLDDGYVHVISMSFSWPDSLTSNTTERFSVSVYVDGQRVFTSGADFQVASAGVNNPQEYTPLWDGTRPVDEQILHTRNSLLYSSLGYESGEFYSGATIPWLV